jgi:4-carboxymuconolactone decarboxylase
VPRVALHTTDEGLDADALAVYKDIEKSRGKVTGVFAALLNSPRVAKLTADLGAYMRFDSVLPAPTRELAILAALRELDCQREWSAHEGFARTAGVPDATIDTVKWARDLAGIPPEEAEVIQCARELLRLRRVSDATADALKARFDDRAFTELVALIGYYAMAGAVLNACEVEPDPGAPRLPERPL